MAHPHFSDPNLLVAEAGLAEEVLAYEAVIAGARTERDRVLAVSLYLFDLAVAQGRGFRLSLARTLDARAASGAQIPALRGAAAWRCSVAP